jgi:hypothetical protein
MFDVFPDNLNQFICFQQNMGLVYKPLPEEIQLQMKLFINQM